MDRWRARRMTTMAVAAGLAVALAGAGAGCAARGVPPERPVRAVPGLPGPEDIVVDGSRLLVSCDPRRDPDAPGAIRAVDLATAAVEELPRRGEPSGLSFHPHGLSRAVLDDGTAVLAVIVHRRNGDPGAAPHAVVTYTIEPHRLVFRELLEDPLLTSPNDLVLLPDGTIYVTNDRSRSDGGWTEVILGLKRATVVRYDGSGGWSVAADHIAMGNGVAVVGDTLVVAATRENALLAFAIGPDGGLGERTRLARVTGPDNLVVDGGRLLVAAHVKPLAFMAHSRNPRRRSPSRVFAVDLADGRVSTVFADDGSTLSAASVAVPAGGALWLGQVFESFILRVDESP